MRSAYRREAQLIRWWIVDFGLLIERGVERQSTIHNPQSKITLRPHRHCSERDPRAAVPRHVQRLDAQQIASRGQRLGFYRGFRGKPLRRASGLAPT